MNQEIKNLKQQLQDPNLTPEEKEKIKSWIKVLERNQQE